MKTDTPNYPKVYLTEAAVKSVGTGYPWARPDGIESVDPDIADGEPCTVAYARSVIGVGTYHSGSDIPLRVLSRTVQPLDTDFFIRRFRELKESKEEFLEDTNAYRLVYGESDGLPGLVADVYARTAVIQIHTLGMEKLKQNIVSALIAVLKPEQIVERSHTGIRTREGLPAEATGVLYGKMKDEVEIVENGFVFRVNVAEGQKTGFFLDQRENRKALVRYCKDRNVLNCFCYTGGFSVYAASAAASVTSVDLSAPAIEAAKANFGLNGYPLEQHAFHATDAFDFLKEIRQDEYQVIVLDPPSFAKNRAQLPAAFKAYTTINSKALEKLPDGGILVSSSCTVQVDEVDFLKILRDSAKNARCTLQVLESRMQPFDHGFNLSFPEGRYLKFFVLRKWPLAR
jgi:23S rRNA (cytosine1962-C5)-methyltransferase